MSSNLSDTVKLQQKECKQSTPIICEGLDRTCNQESEQKKPLGERRRAVRRQQLMVFLGNTGVMGGGMAVALPAVTLTQLTDANEEFNLNQEEASWFSSINSMACPLGGLLVGFLLDRVGRKKTILFTDTCGVLGWALLAAAPLHKERTAIFIQMLIARFISASINSMACPLGGLLVGFLLDRVGRKKTILFTDTCGVLGWALLAAAPLHKERTAIFIQMLIARFISGIMIGLCVSPVGVYSAEISLPRIRGRLILGTSIAIAAGILFMYVLGYFIRNDWQLISIISTVHQLISLICAMPMPETPSWLMLKGYNERARRSLKYFRGIDKNDASFCEEFENELTQIKRSSEQSRSTSEGESLVQAVRAPEVYKPLLLMIGFFGFQQCSGVVVVIVFAVQISIQAGVSIDPVLCAVMVGVARIVTTCFMGTIFEKWGRRPAGIFSASGMTICMLMLAFAGWFPVEFQKAPFVPALCIVLHIVFSTMGLLTLPFFMISEVFPQRVRGSASGFTVSCGLLISFAVVKLYPAMETGMGTANLFAFYGFVSLVAVPFIYFLVPETRGRTLLEIEEYFKTGIMVNLSETEIRRRSSQISPDEEDCKVSFITK